MLKSYWSAMFSLIFQAVEILGRYQLANVRCQREVKFKLNTTSLQDYFHPSTKMKCYVACVLLMEGVLVPDTATIDKYIARDHIESWMPFEHEVKETLLKALEVCATVSIQDPTDLCKSAWSYMNCMIREAGLGYGWATTLLTMIK